MNEENEEKGTRRVELRKNKSEGHMYALRLEMYFYLGLVFVLTFDLLVQVYKREKARAPCSYAVRLSLYLMRFLYGRLSR